MNKKTIANKPLKLAVRKLVETVLRCGDIDNRYVDSSVMHQGSSAHRKIQKSMGENYKKEVSLCIDTLIDNTPVLLQGRADGIIYDTNGKITIDEIKTTTLPLDYIFAQHEQHLGQGKCYAYMLLQSMKTIPKNITVQLTYFQIETEEIKCFSRDFSFDELHDFFTDLLEKYGVWLRYEREWKSTRDTSVKKTSFPFPTYRTGQRELAVATYRTITAGKKLYSQAPTGIGKTLSALFPSIKAIGEGKCEKLFYLTAKTVTRAVAEDALRLMLTNGLRFKSVTLRAKEKICFTEEKICNPDRCPYAKEHYSRINPAILDVINNNDLITPEIIETYAKKHMVCPFEMSLDTSLWVDLVICDYNHVFDPIVYLRRFFNDNNKNNYVFLIDEAHNMADRVRGMYSAEISKSIFSYLRKALKDKNPASVRLRKHMMQINKYLKECKETQKSGSRAEKDNTLCALITSFVKSAEEWLAENQNSLHSLYGDILELYFSASMFITIAELYDEHYTTLTEVEGNNITITLFCLDPSCIIADKLTLAKASVFFSATLTPLPYYREILGGGTDDYIISLPSPFDQNRLLLAANIEISTKYIDREKSYLQVVKAIFAAVSQYKGNYLVYFPSYIYMKKIYDLFCEQYPFIGTLIQQHGMSEDDRADFLHRFDSENAQTLVGFCVLGGIFSEGIDLKGNRLIGSVIVGVGLPGISLRQDEIRSYYNKKNGQGYNYAYVFPGMNKIFQAAGRVIRTETDYGIVLLIDSRFSTDEYKNLLPPHWSNIHYLKKSEEITPLLNNFPFFNNLTDG